MNSVFNEVCMGCSYGKVVLVGGGHLFCCWEREGP